MSGLERKFEIATWLSRTLYESFEDNEIEAWLIGSILNDLSDPADCDVLIVVHPASSPRLARLSPIWREDFWERFQLPLHLTRLTRDEVKTCASFLKAVFSKPHMPIGARRNGSLSQMR